MKAAKTYRTNRLSAFAISVVSIAMVFTADFYDLLAFYRDPWLIVIVGSFGILLPLLLFFGFRVRIDNDRVSYRHEFLFTKAFDIHEISHVLYQPTWAGVMPLNASTSMRSLHIVRGSGGWRETISLANGAFREEDLAEVAKRLHEANPRISLDEHAEALIEKHRSLRE